MTDDEGKNNWRVWLVGGVVVAAVGLGYAVISGDTSTGCKVTTGVAVIANGLTQGRPTTQIVLDATAGLAAAEACEAVVDKLKSQPQTPVTLDVETGEGTGSVAVSGAQLTQQPPIRTTCDDWLTFEYQLACENGQIAPPIIDLNPDPPPCLDWRLEALMTSCQQGKTGPPASE